jgi:hypothetical protein
MAASFTTKSVLAAAIDAVLVLAAAAHETFSWTHWPVYAAALAAQFVLSTLFAFLRGRLDAGERPPLRNVTGLPTVIDLILTLPALSVAAAAGDAPIGAGLTWAALFAIAAGVLSGRSDDSVPATQGAGKLGYETSPSATSAQTRGPRQTPGSSTLTHGSRAQSAGAAGRPRRSAGFGSPCFVSRCTSRTTAGTTIAALA